MEIGIVVLICGILAIAYSVFGRGTWQAPKSTQADAQAMQAYEARANIFVNGAEQALFNALLRHKLQGYHVFTKVRLEDILQVRTSIKDAREKWQYRGRIKSRHVDFLICDRGGAYVCAIELDGAAHHNAEAQMTDDFKDTIFLHAQLPLYRVRTGEDFSQYSQALWTKIGALVG